MYRRNESKCLAAFLLAGCITLTGCSGTNIGGSSEEAFDSYMDELFTDEMTETDTVSLHYTLAYPENYGIADYEVTLGQM